MKKVISMVKLQSKTYLYVNSLMVSYTMSVGFFTVKISYVVKPWILICLILWITCIKILILCNISCSLYTAETSLNFLSFLQIKKLSCFKLDCLDFDFKIYNFWSNLANIVIQFLDKLKLVAKVRAQTCESCEGFTG